MTAFAVKHIAGDLGPISKVMKQVKKAPYSYASNEPEATNAALGNDIYVFEVRAESKGLYSYWLGYKFRAFEKYPPAGGGKWLEKFKFKNAAKACEQAEGSYFDAPVEIVVPKDRKGQFRLRIVARRGSPRPVAPEPLTSALVALRKAGVGTATAR